MVLHRSDARLGSATRPVIERLDPRLLLTSISNSGSGVSTFEFSVAGGFIRVALGGDIDVELIGLEVHPGDSTADPPIPVGQRTLVDMRPYSTTLPAPDVAADIYHIYIRSATEDSFISIANISGPGAGPRPAMTPFGGARTLRVRDIDPDDTEAFTAPALGNVGGVVIGATDIANGESGPDAGTPIIQVPANPATVPLPADAFDVVDGTTVLKAGIRSAPGVNIGKILIGGIVMGQVKLGGSVGLFYAGAILTGDARGIGRATDLRDPDGDPATQDSIDDNFFVDGDLRALVTAGAIGTDTLSADDPLSNRQYNTGADIRVTGRIGTILTGGSFYGGVRADASRPSTEFTSNLRELEFRRPDFTGSVTLFEQGEIGAANALPVVRNDTFATPQMLHTYNDASLGVGDVLQIDGQLFSTAAVGDDLDFYGLPLIAGQTVTIDLQTEISGGNSTLNVGVFDPDGRLIATDYQRSTGNISGLQSRDPNQPFQFTAVRPGVYRIVVGNNGDFEFDGDLSQRPGVGFSRSIATYTLTIRGAADINFGALDVRGSLVTDVVANDTITVMDGDLGAILAGETIAFAGVADAQIRRYWVNQGNLRAMVAESIGFVTTSPISFQGAPHLHVRRGTVGLLQSSGTGNTDVVFVNSLDANAETGTVARNTAVGVDYQVIQSGTTVLGNYIAKRAIGVIRAPSLSYVVGGAIAPLSYFVANADSRGSDGRIGLIDTTGNFGNAVSGGPAIDVGADGNVQYINVGGLVFKDPFFGTPTPSGERTVLPANTAVTLTDDSGTDVTITPVQFSGSRGF
ncbi:MAG: hypothetical protein NZ561_07720, partial [Phycisphaerae bacterium]|nr:hypothetical protein [Phycisphaerae bacterium]MDW8262134.1 hypothetical protein [Phycisphaerales bacterium]